MLNFVRHSLQLLRDSARDLTPIVVVIAFFQLVVLRQPLPETLDVVQLITGIAAVLGGLTLFMHGLELGLFPVGEGLASALTRKGSMTWLLLFAFALGFGTTIAEPALIAVADKAATVVASGTLGDAPEAQARFATELRLTVALSVGVAVVTGVLRIIHAWPLHLMMIGGYAIVMLMTLVAPREIIGIAYDSGGVTTSTITVPLLTALGVGMSLTIKGRNPMVDGFGLIAFASLCPMIFVMGYGLLTL